MTFYKFYPLDTITPQLYRFIKAHKLEKNYPMRTMVSIIGTVACGTAKCLI